MSTYLRMWAKIKETPEEDRAVFIATHEPAKGVNVEFQGETFFDVDLLEALRNSLH